MKINHTTRVALPLAGVAASLVFLAGAALAAPADHIDRQAGVWGPDLAGLCDQPTSVAESQGYNVIFDEIVPIEAGGLLFGTSGPDIIFANNGNDIVYAGRGNDIVCGGSGEDILYGEGGNDILRADGHNDKLRGGNNDDFLDGGGIFDECDGGNGFDATANCEVVAP